MEKRQNSTFASLRSAPGSYEVGIEPEPSLPFCVTSGHGQGEGKRRPRGGNDRKGRWQEMERRGRVYREEEGRGGGSAVTWDGAID